MLLLPWKERAVYVVAVTGNTSFCMLLFFPDIILYPLLAFVFTMLKGCYSK